MARPLRRVPIHELRPNHTSWTPPALISFDTETVSDMSGDDEVMTLRLWCARFTDRRKQGKVKMIDDFDSGKFAEDLAVTIHKWTRQRRTVWGYAHNLGFDLCTSDLIQQLIYLHWEVTEFAVGTGSPFVRLRQGDHSLTLSDSWSWFQCELARVGEAVGIPKLDLPGDDHSEQAWFARCESDVNILHEAMLQLMDWWDSEDIGKWNLTGSASGWNAMRHKPTPERILIRPDDDECDHDRRSIYGGKRFVWQSGHYSHGTYDEVDIVKAYTVACRDLPLPVGRQAQFVSLPTDHRWLDCDRWGVIAECTISTDTARVPVRMGNSVWYPVGRFRTTLAGPDIREARALGSLESVGGGWLHRLGYALRPWADWCIASQLDESGATPEVAKLVHRAWGRSAVGKWAQRGFEVVDLGPSPNQGWHYEEAWHHEKNVPAGIVDFGGKRYQVAAVNQSDNAYPAVLAFVESYVRVALNRATDIMAGTNMVACDTDGYICRGNTADQMALVNQAIAPFQVRVKRQFRRIKVIGPQHMELDQIKRRSGIPAKAVKLPDGKLWARTWPKLAWQLANGRQGAYVRPSQTYKLASTYAPGWVLSDGSVVPIEMELDASGCNQIVPFPLTRYGRSGKRLAPDQNRQLVRYRGDQDT